MTRRTVLAGSLGLAAGAATSLPFLVPRYDHDLRPTRSRVAILAAKEYSEGLCGVLWEGLRLFNLNVAGSSVLLKPNLVDYVPEAEINTHPLLIAAARRMLPPFGSEAGYRGGGPGPPARHRTGASRNRLGAATQRAAPSLC